MRQLLVALAVLPFTAEARQSATEQLPSFYAEDGAKYSVKDGVVELQGGPGWLRVPHVYLDFRLAFEFRATTDDTDAGVVVRTWTHQGGWPRRGYRFRLPTGLIADAASAFEARREKMKVVQRGNIRRQELDSWHSVEVTGAGREVTIVMNDEMIGVFQVEGFAGHILFDNPRGNIELRSIRVVQRRSASGRSDGLMTLEELQKAGGQVPKVVREVKPSYTAEAMDRKVQGVVLLEAVVLRDGSVGPIGVVRSLDWDLNQTAVAALKKWKFKPGILSGKEVAVLVEVEMTFTLK